MDRARRILEGAPQELRNTPQLPDGRPTWVLLPEMAFTGYNFTDITDIYPLLEPTKSGPSTQWAESIATKYKWFVTVGYPEIATSRDGQPVYFNSSVTVSPNGSVVAHYRKSFLYYTDETWASEGEIGDSPDGTKAGFFAEHIEGLGNVSMGICMDINPYQFIAPFNDYEFANHVLNKKSDTVVVNMSWLTRLLPQELQHFPLRPDTEQFHYWIERFHPLIEATARNPGKSVVVACANRCGVEGGACYSGSSCVMLFQDGQVLVHDILGKLQEKCLVADITKVRERYCCITTVDRNDEPLIIPLATKVWARTGDECYWPWNINMMVVVD